MQLDFAGGMAPPTSWRFVAGSGALLRHAEGLRLILPRASQDHYSDAQLDDFHGRTRQNYVWHPPVTLRIQARFSHPAAHWPGTAGFGFWNAPFATEVASPLALRAPNVLWFFVAGPPTRMAFAPRPGWQGRGSFAQSLALEMVSGLPGLLTGGALAVSTYLQALRARLPTSIRNRVTECPLPGLDITAWHTYEILWRPNHALIQVDGQTVLSTSTPPTGPLALVVWLDNQWAALGPPWGYQGGLHSFETPHWLDIAALSLHRR